MKKNATRVLLILAGLSLIGLGIYAFLNPLYTYVKLVKHSGLALLFNGAFLQLISASAQTFPKERKWLLAESVLDFCFGLLLLFNPLLSFIVFPFLIGPWVLSIGVLKILASLDLKPFIRGWMFITAFGILAAVFGLLILFDPFPNSNGITILIGIFGIVMGAIYIYDAFRFRHDENTLNLIV